MCLFNMRDKFTWNAGFRNYFFFILHSYNIVKNLLLFPDVPRHAAMSHFYYCLKKDVRAQILFLCRSSSHHKYYFCSVQMSMCRVTSCVHSDHSKLENFKLHSTPLHLKTQLEYNFRVSAL